MIKTKIRLRNPSSKKAQMEVFGLAVIVILLVVGMLFMIRFVILRPQQQAQQSASYINKDLASNIVVYMQNIAINPADVCNKKLDLTDLIRDCAYGEGSIRCLDKVPSYVESCSIARKIIEEDILAKTLDEFQHDYYFSVYKSGTGDIIDNLEINNKCPGKKTSGIAFIPLPPDVLNLQLDICN